MDQQDHQAIKEASVLKDPSVLKACRGLQEEMDPWASQDPKDLRDLQEL